MRLTVTKRIRFKPLVCLAALALACSGCQSLSPKWPATWPTSWFADEKPKVEESQYARPVRVAALWSPAMLSQPGKPATRGFGGRLYFYDGANKPISVEGQLVVYAYDEAKKKANSKSPDARFAFTPEQFTGHYSPTDLGASYSVWIPWDPVGGPQVEISLLPVFTATGGQLVVGEASKNILPGTVTPSETPKLERFTIGPMAAAQQPDSGVQQASFEQTTAAAPQRGVETLSIRVPGTLADRIAHAQPQQSIALQLAKQRAEMLARMADEQRLRATASGQLPQSHQAGQALVGAAPPAANPAFPRWSHPNLPQDHFARPTPPAPEGQLLPQAGGPLPTPRSPLGLPSALPLTPQSVPPTSGQAAWPGGYQTGP
jgi:hypothetical protein